MKFDSLARLVRTRSDALRKLKPTDIIPLYTEEQRKRVYVRYDLRYDETIADKKYGDKYRSLRIRLKAQGRALTWSPQEDSFLIANHRYLSDTVIGLALNRPSGVVKMRRRSLKLSNKWKLELDVVVWNKRDTFEEDARKLEITKERPITL